MNHPNSPNGKIDKSVSSRICPCGSIKKEDRPFCWSCSSLVKEHDSSLYYLLFRSGEAFYRAYEEALEYLKEVGEVR